MTTVAFVSAQRLTICHPGEPPRTVSSRFAETVRERAVQQRRKHGWKQQGRGARFQGAMLWGMDGDDVGTGPAAFITSLGRGRKPGELLYTLSTERVSALCAIDALADDPEATETRVFHSADHRVSAVATGGPEGFLACDLPTSTGVSNLAVMLDDGSDITELTGGDSVDHAPAWIPGRDREIVFQSAGVGRDAGGQMVALGPYAIQRLEVATGEITPLVERDDADHLGPRCDAEGHLYFIRRPYRRPDAPVPLWRALLDFLLMPFRLLAAVFGWLNFFSARYAGKPLTTAGGPGKRGADAKQMLIWGNLIEASQRDEDEDGPSLVPRSWQLVRRSPDGDEEVIARSVVSFDLGPDGTIAYTTGRAVYRLEGTKPQLVAKGDGITHLVVVA